MLPDLINNKKWIFMRKLLHLFLMFFKIGLFTFGGGYEMLPCTPSGNERRALFQ